MDSISQAVLGAAVAEEGLGGRRLGKAAVGWGILLGTLPDLDVLLFPFLDPVQQLEWHRGASHSLLIVLLASPLFGWMLSKIHTARISFWRATLTVFAIFTTHVLIDVFTVYGTLVWWPFSEARVGTNNFFIIDPLFTLPLLAGVGVAFFAKSPKLRTVANLIGLVLAGIYTLWSFAALGMARSALEDAIRDNRIPAEALLVSPTPFNTILWRGLVRTEEELKVAYFSLLAPGPVEFETLVQRGEVPAGFQGTREWERLEWFSEGFFSVKSTPAGLEVHDWRFGEIRDLQLPVSMTNQPVAIFSWLLQAPGSEGWREMQRIRPAGSRAEVLGSVFRRALGEDEATNPVKNSGE